MDVDLFLLIFYGHQYFLYRQYQEVMGSWQGKTARSIGVFWFKRTTQSSDRPLCIFISLFNVSSVST